MILLIYTATLIHCAPIAVPILIRIQLAVGHKGHSPPRGSLLTYALTAGVSLITAAVFILVNQQPQHKAYALLEDPPQSIEGAGELLLQEKTIRNGLLNAYLAPVRYISAVGEVGHIQELYQWSLDISDEAAQTIEKVFEVAARPMLYEPMSPSEIIEIRQAGGTNSPCELSPRKQPTLRRLLR